MNSAGFTVTKQYIQGTPGGGGGGGGGLARVVRTAVSGALAGDIG